MDSREIRARRAEIIEEAQAMIEAAEAEDRNFTEDEQEEYDGKLEKAEELEARAQRRESLPIVAPIPPVENRIDVDTDIAAIEVVQSQYCVAMETGDLELWLSLHADDMVKMAPNAPATYGIEELRASTKPLFDTFTIEMVGAEEV